jgi:hypothetical protein
MRFLSVLILSLFFSAPAFAALTANQWQSQLQAEIQRIEASSSDIKLQGGVTVQEVNGMLQATLPAMTVVSPDKSQWSIPSISLQASSTAGAAAPVTITLPASITRYNASKQEIAKMTLGSQALNGNWNMSGSYFETLNGNIKNVTFNDTIAHSQSNVGNIALSANQGSQVQFLVTDIRNTTLKDRKQLNSAVAKMNVAYQLSEGNKLTLMRIIGLFTPVLLLTENQKVGITATAEQVSLTGADDRTTTMQKLVSTWTLQPKGKIIGATSDTKVFVVRQSPESLYSFVLPQQMDMTATISDLPLELVSFAPGMSFTMAKEALAKSGTTIDVSKLMIRTFDQAVLNGNGKLKANSSVPSGFTGRITLQVKDLKELISTMQMQLLQPDSGTNRASKTKALMAAMMLQGMGKQNGANTEFVIDLTADGQTLVNGQDFSGLIPGGKGAAMPTAMPVPPVTGSDI